MVLIIIAFISLIGLIVLHEFGHFILAKKFGVRVDEFGVGYPPRIIGRKIGETVYSLNLLPFGAFVKIYGEDGGGEGGRAFGGKPLWQRALIILGGVVSFWLISAVLFSFVAALGAPTVVEDDAEHGLLNSGVQISGLAPDSPAEKAGLKPGDFIKKLEVKNDESGIKILEIDKVKEVIEFTNVHQGEEVFLTIKRGEEIFDVSLVPRVSPPAGQGAMGVALVRTAIVNYPIYEIPFRGALATANLTMAVVRGYGDVFGKVLRGEPSGVQAMGPVGILGLMSQAAQMGAVYFIQFVAIIAVYVALFNILPIPAVDGGKLLFLAIEGFRKKPFNPKIEEQINGAFFLLLIILMIWVTIGDITRIFNF